MRLCKWVVLAISLLLPLVALTQQSSSHASDEGADLGYLSKENGILVALIDQLNEKKGVIAYDDLNRSVLRRFSCHDEYNKESVDIRSKVMAISDTDVKSSCGDISILFSGRTHSSDANHFKYWLSLLWRSKGDQCIRADAALKALNERAWLSQRMLDGAPSIQNQFLQTYPNTELYTSKNASGSIFVAWVPRGNPGSLQNVDPAAGCLRHLDVRN